MAAIGKARSSAFSSCRQTTSGCATVSQSIKLARRLLTLLMLKVAIRTRQAAARRMDKTSAISGACDGSTRRSASASSK